MVGDSRASGSARDPALKKRKQKWCGGKHPWKWGNSYGGARLFHVGWIPGKKKN